MSNKNRYYFIIALVLLVILQSSRLAAAEWTMRSQVSVSETYIDNVSLAPKGEEREEFITGITPGISLIGQGNRLNTTMQYQFQGLYYAKEERGVSHHRFNGQLDTELVTDLLFLDLNAAYRQQNITVQDRISFDNLSLNANRTDVTTYTISPYLTHNFGDYATTLLRFSRNEVLYDTKVRNDTKGDSYLFRVNNGSKFKRMIWGASHERNEISAVQDIVIEKSELLLGYRIGPKTTARLVGGYEDNDYPHDAVRGGISESYWNAGLSWTPSHRTLIELSGGERFFGKTASLSVQQSSRQMDVGIAYREDVTTISQLALRAGRADAQQEVTDARFLDEEFFTELTDEVFVRKNTSAFIVRRKGNSDVSLRIFDEKREYQSSGNEEKSYGASLGGRARLAARLDGHTSFYWQKHQLNGDSESTLQYFVIGLDKEISSDINLALDYRYSSQERDSLDSDYIQNMLHLGINVLF